MLICVAFGFFHNIKIALFPFIWLNSRGLLMTKKSEATKNRMSRLLLEYLKDSSRSDRELAKVLGVSQPTISRMKRRLIEEGIVRHFSVIPDLAKIGYELMAFSLVKFNLEQMMNVEGKSSGWARNYPFIIFTARAEGMGFNAITISLHKNYAEYQNFLTENREKWEKFGAEAHYILVDLKGEITKPLSFEYLTETPEK